MKRSLQIACVSRICCREPEPGFVMPGEADSGAKLIYVDQGSLHSVAEGKDLLLKQGELVIYRPGQWHMQYADIGVAPCFVSVTFELSCGQLQGLWGRKFHAPAELLRQLLREAEENGPHGQDMVTVLLEMLLIRLLRQTVDPVPKPQTVYAIHSENQLVSRAQQYIGANIRQKLTVPQVARMVDVSPSYLTALFHKHLKISPGEYIRRIKLQHSKQLIREGKLNFTEIAEELQYSTVHHFSRQFKEKFGITPTEYSRSVRQGEEVIWTME